jgi:hypothetical protein
MLVVAVKLLIINAFSYLLFALNLLQKYIFLLFGDGGGGGWGQWGWWWFRSIDN